ncbi:MAG: ComEC/Rec2 family competence protein [Chloroflexota bacterium]|nr:ComEC/Rec2 family competence protein [Chloroflexota bacterium]MDE2948345.1 ComEC/Rec2 family competence protein [Chloroflexota bacterium]
MRLIVLGCAWVLGISIARSLPAVELSYWTAALIASSVAGLLLRRRLPWWFLVSLAAFSAGGARQSLLPGNSDVANYNGYSGTISGIVVAEPGLREDRIQLRLASETIFVNSETIQTSGLVLVEADRGVEVQYGDRIRATGRLAVPATWDTFSYADYLARHGVFTIMRHAAVDLIDSGHGSALAAALLSLKETVRGSIASALPEPQAGLLTGILLGDESGIAPELEEAFARVGASHVVAISGFNMVIVSGIVLRALSGLFRGHKTVVTLNALSVIAVYTLLVGASPGVLRAALMSGLLVIGNQLNRKTFVPASLAFAALLLSFFDPNVLLDIGFQLSFLAVLGLSLFADPLSRRFRRLLEGYLPPRSANALHSFLNEPLIVSIAAQITTLPLVILYFGRLSLVALPVNFLIVPVQSAALLLGMAAAVAYTFVPVVGTLIFWAELVFISWTISVVRAFAQLSFAEITVDLDGRLIQAYYLLLIGGAMFRAARSSLLLLLQDIAKRNSVILFTCAAAALSLILIGAMFLSRADGHLHVWLLDLGHSNAVLAQTPGGAQVLVDGGRFPARLLTAIGDRLPFHDRDIEILVITHPDAWDIAALSSVLDRYSVGAALYHGQATLDEDFEQILARLSQAGTAVAQVRAGYTVDVSDGATIEVLHPQAEPKITDKLNDHVLALRLRYGAASFLLTSDLSAEGQQAMLDSIGADGATVLQIPQHGTVRALDDDFLAAVKPQIALLQSDIANRRGDPDPDTLAELEEVDLFRTDELGTIHLRTDGKTISVSR